MDFSWTKLARAVLCFWMAQSLACSFGTVEGGYTPEADVSADAAVDTGPEAGDADTADAADGVARDAQLPDDVQCLTERDCYAGETCDSFRCVPIFADCRSDRDCPSPRTCLGLQGVCRDGVCEYDALEPGEACDDHDACTADSVCDEMLDCVGGRNICVAPEPQCRDARVVVAAAYLGCDQSEEPCQYHWVGAECADCDLAACLCAEPCAPMFDGCAVGICANGECTYDALPDGSDCPSGQCLAGRCVECVDGRDCPTDDACRVGRCSLLNECAWSDAADGSACSRGSDDGVCVDGTCQECASDAGCNEFRPNCVDGTCAECTLPSDCAEGAMACEAGRCFYCATAADCDDDDSCTYDYCASRVGHCRHARYSDCAAP